MRNLEALTQDDEVKFVLSTRRDYEFARDFMLQHGLARKFIIAPRRKHEFHFVVLRQRLEIPHIKSIRLSRVRALYIHDLDDLAWKPISGTFSARLYHYRVAGIQ